MRRDCGLRVCLLMALVYFLLSASSFAQAVDLSISTSNLLGGISRQMSMGTGELAGIDFLGDSARLSNGYAAAEAGFGVARVHASASYEETRASEGFGASTAFAQWQDTLTIVPGDLGLLGTTGHVDVVFQLTGSGGAQEPVSWGSQGEAFASYEFQVTLGTFDYHPFGWWYGNGSFIGIQPGGVTNWSFDMRFGEPFTHAFWVQTHAHIASSGASEGSAQAYADFSRESRWLGISRVMDDNFIEVTNYAVTSGSGTDWALPRIIPPAGVSEITASGGMVDLALDHLSLALTNVVQISGSVDSTNWQIAASLPDASGGTNVVLAVGTNSNTRFFRIRAD